MSRGTLDPAAPARLSLTGLSPSLAGLPRAILLALPDCVRGPKPRDARIPVWALSISLAATLEIDVSFSSSGYLDVSVRRVPFHTLWIGVWIHGMLHVGFPIQTSPARWVFAPPRSFSQLITSFIGS